MVKNDKNCWLIFSLLIFSASLSSLSDFLVVNFTCRVLPEYNQIQVPGSTMNKSNRIIDNQTKYKIWKDKLILYEDPNKIDKKKYL